MEEPRASKGELAIEAMMQGLDPKSDRYRVLASARQFKSSWVELGAQLVDVHNRRLYTEWGYDSFDTYCLREIRIKKPTAQKLTLAYRYMEREEPELLTRESEIRPLPDFRSVEVLRQARDEKGFNAEEYDALRRVVMEEERSYPTVLKRFKEVAAAKEPAAESLQSSLRAALAATRRLETALTSLEGVSSHHLENVTSLASELQDSINALKEE